MKAIKKRILILTPGFPSDEQDLNCLPFLQKLLQNWKKLYPDVELLVMTFQYPFRNEAYTWHGIPVIPMNGRNKGGLIRQINKFRIRDRLLAIYREAPVDAIFSLWYGECAWAGHWLKLKTGTPHFCWLWGQDARKQNKYPSRLKLGSNEIIALSDSLASVFQAAHGTKVDKVIPPGMDLAENSLAKDIDLLGAGSLIPLKQFELFIEVAAELKRKLPSLRAMIAGKGNEEQKLRSLIRHYHLENEVVLAGEVSNSELLRMMQRSKVLLHPSSYEGFSISCLEAIYAGTQVCSFCFPMNQPIPNWHVVKDKYQMIETSLALLNTAPLPIQDPFPIAGTINKMMELV